MSGGFNPIIAALCVASISQLSDFSNKELLFERIKNSTKTQPINLENEKEKALVLAVATGNAKEQEIKQFKDLVIDKAEKADSFFHKFCLAALNDLIKYTTENPDISKIQKNTKTRALKLFEKINKITIVFLPLKDNELYSKIFYYFVKILEKLNFAATNPSKCLLGIFKEKVEATFNFEQIKTNFLTAYKAFHDKNGAQSPEITEALKTRLLVATICYRMAINPEQVLDETTSEQLKNLERDSTQIFEEVSRR